MDSDQQVPPPVFVRQGTVLAGAVPFKFNNNINPVYRGQIACSDGTTVSAFIKDIDQRQFANELLAAAIGLKAGLPIPPPIIARASPDIIPTSKIRLAGTEDFLMFASGDAKATPILQVLNEKGAQAAETMQRIGGWGQLGTLYGFDTWIANTDRHRGNLLLGDADEIWLIDHGHSFTGPAWTADSLLPAHPYLNKLSHWLTPTLSGARRAELAAPAAAITKEISLDSLHALGAANFVETMLGDDFGAIMTFLKDRAEHVPHLSTGALGMLV